MNSNPILGTGVILLGGVAAATCLLPSRRVRGWAYEAMLPTSSLRLPRGWFSSVLGVWLDEWKGTSLRTKLSLLLGEAVSVSGFVLMAMAGRG